VVWRGGLFSVHSIHPLSIPLSVGRVSMTSALVMVAVMVEADGEREGEGEGRAGPQDIATTG
jgi:hypothetical protein